ncbi:MAG: pyridoxal phosphate-dependent aminotransferase [Candidatus Odinarchaeia archaeon]
MNREFISSRMDKIPPSGTINMFELALSFEKKGEKILHLEVGEPDFDTPENIRDAAKKFLSEGMTHYTSSRGVFELREAISRDLSKRNCDYSPDEILVTPGAKHAILASLLVTLNPGDEVIILTPAWPTYQVMVKMADAKPVFVPTSDAYELSTQLLQNAINPKTKMIIINSPNNPTGGVLSNEEMKAIADIAIDKNLLVLSDEIYDQIVYDGFKQTSLPSLDNMKSNSILINGFSKSYAMTGWRLGYVAAEKTLIDYMNRIQQNSTTCATSFAQYAAVEALKTPESVIRKMLRTYDKRRKLIVDLLNEIPGITCELPKGAFYVFPRYDYDINSKDLAERILKEVKVTTTPGAVFQSENHLRISYAVSEDVIVEALTLLKKFFNTL